jgi:multisubunit Na+/H+ antiporter MnhF subunit
MKDLIVFSVVLAVIALSNFYRFVKGPTAADRVVASDCADILVSLAMMLFSLYSGRGIYLDIAIITAMLGIINTMLIGRYLDKGRWIYHADDIEDSD